MAPSIRIEAPGRVNLIGEHIDYLEGWVMPAAIEPHLSLLAAPGSSSGGIEVWTSIPQPEHRVLPAHDFTRKTRREDHWLNYPIGVMGVYAERGALLPPCRIDIASTLPTGAGLSSSAALETAIALLIEAFTGHRVSVRERALLCQRAEHEWAGMPCGIMDQLSVGAGQAGHVLRIDCLDLTVTPVPLPPGVCLVVADTGVKHALADGAYRKRREDCEAALERLGATSFRDISPDTVAAQRDRLGDRLHRRARHAVTEMRRVAAFAEALEEGHEDLFPRLMREGHDSLRDDFEVSCPELDALVDAGYAFGPDRGHLGSRMTGGGFGGSTVHLVREEAAPAYLDHLRDRYRAACGRETNCFVTRASDGARCRLLTPDPSFPSTR